MLTTGNQLKAARALIGIEQSKLAEKAGLNVNTIRNMEASEAGPIAGRAVNVRAVQKALEDQGILFIEPNGGGPGVRLKAPPAAPAEEPAPAPKPRKRKTSPEEPTAS